MLAESALGDLAVAQNPTPASLAQLATNGFDIFQTVISQYANSPVLLELVGNMAAYIDPTTNFDQFYILIWNVDTAQGYGLDVWGRIVGVSRVLNIPITGQFFGFDEATDAFPFGEEVFFGGSSLTSNFALSDTAFRRLILAKALSNISDGSIPGINQILINLFSGYGNCYVTDDGNMTMTYTFGSTLTPVDLAIASQTGILPKPAGVTVSIVQL